MNGGHVYKLDEVTVAELKALIDAVSVNGALPDYSALDFSLQVDASGCAPSANSDDYKLTLTFTTRTNDTDYTFTETFVYDGPAIFRCSLRSLSPRCLSQASTRWQKKGALPPRFLCRPKKSSPILGVW